MNRIAVAQELMRVAHLLKGGPAHGFTVLKPLKLESEGSTRSALANAKAISDAGYKLETAMCSFDRQRGNYYVKATFERGSEQQSWLFKGFSAGYGGEGPHGLLEFAKLFGINLDADKVLGREYMEQNGLLGGKEFRIIELM